jgi:Abi-like protein
MLIQMTALEEAEFRTSISVPRFTPYTRATSNFNQALALYAWNLQLAAALMYSLHMFEVCLRNRLSAYLTIKYGANWPFSGTALRQMTGNDRRRLTLAIADLQSSYRGRAPTVDEITAHLSLGFWVSFLTRSYSVPLGWHGPGLRVMYPNDPAIDQPTAYRIANNLRVLRNRIAHHEPVHHLPVAQLYSDLDRLLAAMCVGSRSFVRAGSSVTSILAQRP